MADYSGIISLFNHSLPTSGTDLMSSVVTGTGPSTTSGLPQAGQWVNSNGQLAGGYTYGYMYIGELLVQFTTMSVSMPKTSSDGSASAIAIYYPISFGTAGPYCVLPNPLSISNSSSGAYEVLVTATSPTNFIVQTGNGGGYIQYIAIGPKP
jgi:hypothetical protein